jgi:hypothetical protein
MPILISNIWPDLKLKLTLTNKRLAGERPNTFLGVIPVGSEKMSYPLSNIASVQTTARVLVGHLLVGVLLVYVGITVGLQRGGWFWFLMAGLFLLYCYRAQMNIQNSGGGVISHRISVWNKRAAQSFAQEINTAIAERES